MKALDQIRKAVRDKYAWPGGYPLAILMVDGEAICCNCARKEWRQIVAAKMHPGTSRDWQPVAAFINWEDETLTEDFEPEVRKCLERHHYGDWGDVCDEDKALNDAAVNEGSRLLSAYTVLGTKIWIITEADRSVTTILLPEEY